MGVDVDARQLGAIAELAMVATAPDVFRRQLLDVLDRTIGFDKASLHHTQANGVGLCERGYEHPGAFAELPQFMSELAPHEIANASGTPVVDVEVLSARRRDRLSLYQKFLRPERVSVYTTVLWRGASGIAGLTLARTGRPARFTPVEKKKLESLLPAIRLGDAVVTLRHREEAVAPSFNAWADAARLSAKERQVAALVVRGLTNPEIAGVLRVSVHTVRNQLAAVFRKLDVSTRAELVFVATSPVDRGEITTQRWMQYVR